VEAERMTTCTAGIDINKQLDYADCAARVTNSMLCIDKVVCSSDGKIVPEGLLPLMAK